MTTNFSAVVLNNRQTASTNFCAVIQNILSHVCLYQVESGSSIDMFRVVSIGQTGIGQLLAPMHSLNLQVWGSIGFKGVHPGQGDNLGRDGVQCNYSACSTC